MQHPHRCRIGTVTDEIGQTSRESDKPAWVTATAFGRPVDPEVKIR